MKNIKSLSGGVLLCAAIAALSFFLGNLKIGNFSLEIVGAPVFSVLIGMVLTLFFPALSQNEKIKPGVRFASKKILQWAVIILGFSLNLSSILKVGGKSLPVIASTITVSLLTAFFMMRILKLEPKIACLIGVGSSICGGSAIAATAPVIDADDETVARSISVIFLFNVLAALIFPTIGYHLGFGTEGFAVFAGTAVNDTSSVTAAASAAEGIFGSDAILSAAVTVKLTRTLAIIPITLGLALWRTYRAQKSGGAKTETSFGKIFPWFILYFIAASLITTLMGLLPESLAGVSAWYSAHFVRWMKTLAKFFIAMAMAGIGLNTRIGELIRKGGKPILLGAACWVMISLTSIGVQLLTGLFYTNL